MGLTCPASPSQETNTTKSATKRKQTHQTESGCTVSPCLCLCVSLGLYLSLSPCIYLSLSVCLYVSPSLSVSLSLSDCVTSSTHLPGFAKTTFFQSLQPSRAHSVPISLLVYLSFIQNKTNRQKMGGPSPPACLLGSSSGESRGLTGRRPPHWTGLSLLPSCEIQAVRRRPRPAWTQPHAEAGLPPQFLIVADSPAMWEDTRLSFYPEL